MREVSLIESRVPLIITGDDFGYSESVNRGIIHAYKEGLLTSASLMVNEQAAGQAVELSLRNPGLAVGLHLVLVLGSAALPHKELLHITDEHGRFSDSSFRAGLKYFFNPSARRELRSEMRAQFERFTSTGIPFSHVDGHTHLHMHPTIFRELIELCEEFDVRRVRVVKGEIRTSLKLDRKNIGIKLLWGTVFNILGRWCDKQLTGRDFICPQRVYGLLQSGNMNEDYLLGLLREMERETTEIYSHPIALDADENSIKENPCGISELQALLSYRLHKAVDAAGFVPATYSSSVLQY